jgi:hypothetical protein
MRSINILCIAIQTVDKALLTYLVIDVGMIVRWTYPYAFELGNANPDLRETQVVLEFGIHASHQVPLVLWHDIRDKERHATTNFLISMIVLAALMPNQRDRQPDSMPAVLSPPGIDETPWQELALRSPDRRYPPQLQRVRTLLPSFTPA